MYIYIYISLSLYIYIYILYIYIYMYVYRGVCIYIYIYIYKQVLGRLLRQACGRARPQPRGEPADPRLRREGAPGRPPRARAKQGMFNFRWNRSPCREVEKAIPRTARRLRGRSCASRPSPENCIKLMNSHIQCLKVVRFSSKS